MKTEFKPLTVQDFGLTPEETKILVVGAQHFLPPEDESPEPPAKEEKTHANQP